MIRIIILVLSLFLSRGLWADVSPEIAAKLNSEDSEQRSDACLALGQLRDPEAVPLLEERLKDNSMLVRHSAANALAQIGGDEANRIFNQMVASASMEKKRLGLAGLAMSGDKDSVPAVLKELDNDNWQVRWSAVYALGEWGYRPALARLQEIAESDLYLNKTTGEYPVRNMARISGRKIECAISWRRDMDSARILQQELQKPVLIYWFVPKNDWCRKMEDIILFSPEVADLSQNFICVKINAAEEKELVAGYDIQAVPAIIIIDKQGEIVDRLLGLRPRKQLIERWKKALENKGTPQEWKKQVAKDPKDIESAWCLAEWYLDNNKIRDAIPLLKSIMMYDPRNKSGYSDNAIFALGYSLGAVKKYREAIDILRELRRKYPNFKDMDKALFCLGLDYLSVDDTDAARQALTDLVNIYPERSTAKPAGDILKQL